MFSMIRKRYMYISIQKLHILRRERKEEEKTYCMYECQSVGVCEVHTYWSTK